MQVQFAAGAYQSRSLPLDAQRCINFFSEQAPSKEAESLIGVFGCPGLSAFTTAGSGAIRGFTIMAGMLYVVTATGFASVSSTGVVTMLNGAVAVDGTAPVSIANNGTQVVFVTGASGFVYQVSGLNQTLSAYSGAGATSVTVTNLTGTVVAGDPINITLDAGSTFSTTASAAAVGNTISLTTALPSSASIGNTIYTPNNVFAKINAAAFYPAVTVTYLDGYFLFERTGTTQCFFSGLLDGTSYNGLDFISKESNPDLLVRVANLHQTLVLMGQLTTELWQDVGGNDSPFQIISGSTIQRGTGAPLSVLQEDNSLFFLGNDLVYYRLDAYQPVRVSTHVEETEWAGYTVTSDAFSFVVVWEGHKFIHVTFPTAQATWVFDIATGIWHERESWIANNVSIGRWRGNCAITCYGKVLVGDSQATGYIGVYDYSVFTEWGCTIRGLMTSPPIHKDRKRIFMSVLETYWESGVGLISGQGSNPQVFLDWSDDGGRTWSKLILPASIGAMGQYKQRTRWLRLGQSRTRTLRLTVTDPVRRNLVGAYIEASAGF